MSCGGNCKCNQSKGAPLALNLKTGTKVTVTPYSIVIPGALVIPNVFRVVEGVYLTNEKGFLVPIVK